MINQYLINYLTFNIILLHSKMLIYAQTNLFIIMDTLKLQGLI